MSYKIKIFILFFLQTQYSWAQVRIFQWSDAHSTLKTLTQQIVAIDQMSQDYLNENPKGEVVILVNGDFTSINNLSENERGWMSLRALEFLKQKGYTVIFIPGNHDAFDWTETLNGAELFFQQMAYLNSIGVQILAANIVHAKHPLKNFISKSYRLKSLKKETHIVGMTLDILPQKANLSDAAILRLMDRVEGYDETLNEVLPELKKNGVDQVILAVHQGHKKLAKLADRFSDKKPHISHYLAGDDHVVASYEVKGSVISDGGSHGSFNVLDFDKHGTQVGTTQHVSIDSTALSYVDSELFKGVLTPNLFSVSGFNGLNEIPGFLDFQLELDQLVKEREELSQTVVGFTEFGFQSSKKDMKAGRTTLGSLIAYSLELGVRALLSPLARFDEPVITFVHSGSYKLEGYFPAGPIKISLIKETYPYRNMSKVYRMTGEEITDLYVSLKAFYSKDDPKKFTPQMNFNVREKDDSLEVFHLGEWHKLKKHTTYIIAFDGWLSTQNYGEGFRIPIWNQIFARHEPIVSEVFQDLQIRFLPVAIANYENGLNNQNHKSNLCESYLY